MSDLSLIWVIVGVGLGGVLAPQLWSLRRRDAVTADQDATLFHQFASAVLLLLASILLVRNTLNPAGVFDDPMLLTGFLATALALIIGIFNDRSCLKLLSALQDAGIVNLTSKQLRSYGRWHASIQMIVHFTIVVMFSRVGTIAATSFSAPTTMVVFYSVAGVRFARVMANGLSILWIGCHRIDVSPIIGHRDGAGGFAMVGDFFLRQSVPSTIPLGWLTYWMVAVFAEEACRCEYGDWIDVFPLLVGIVVIAVLCGAVLPMAVFSCRISEWKNRPDTYLRGQSSSTLRYEIATLRTRPLSLDAIRTASGSIVVPILLAIFVSVPSYASLCQNP